MFTAPGRRQGVSQSERRFADARSTNEKSVRAALQTASKELIEFRIAAWGKFSWEILVVFGGDQAREDLQPARRNYEIVKAAAEVDAAHFDQIGRASCRE